MTIAERVRGVVAPVLAAADTAIELVDVEHLGGVLRVTVDQPGGIDLETIAVATRLVSRALDQSDPLPGRYTLEVSSPGLERPLRSPDQFRRAIGTEVMVKATAEVDGDRRFQGMLVAADDHGVTVRDPSSQAEHHLRHDQIEKARTIFVWGPAPKPGAPKNRPKKAATR